MNPAVEDLIVVGAGGASREIVWAVEEINALQPRWRVLGFLDDDPAKQGAVIHGYPVLGPTSAAGNYPASRLIVGIASYRTQRARRQVVERLACPPERFATIIAPKASVSRHAHIGRGTAVLHNSSVAHEARLGDHVLITFACAVEHDAVLEDYVTLASGVCVSGSARIETGAYLGSGSLIRDGKTVGHDALVGMGSVVLQDVPAETTVLGNPAAVIRGEASGMSAQPIAGQNILITGGAGLVGSHIADLVIAEGAAHVTILDNLSRGRPENLTAALESGRVRLVRGDIRDPHSIAAVMDGADVVFHQAAIRITQCAEEPRLALDVLSTGTFNVLEAAVRAKVKKVVAASSASVYGLAGQFPTTEEQHPYHNRTLYGAAKVFNEGLLRSFYEMYGLDYVALRYFNVYGPRMDIHGIYTEVLIRWMERIASGHAPIIFGDGLQTMDFIHVRDVARANLLAAQSPATDQAINVASGTETSLKDLALALMRVTNCSMSIEYRPERKVNPVSRRLGSTAKAERLLQFQSRISLDEGLRGLVEWWRLENQAVTNQTGVAGA